MNIVKPSKKLVVVADDYGLCDRVNCGVEKAFLEGIVTEISLMAQGNAAANAFAFLKRNKVENVGIHLELSNGKVMHETDYNRLFREKSFTDIRKIFCKEIEIFETTLGQKPSHITAHKGIHGNFKLIREVIEYACANNIPVRRPHADLLGSSLEESNYAAEIMIRRAKLKTTNHLFANVRGSNSERIRRKFVEQLQTVPNGGAAEILLHPGFFDQELLEVSSLNYERCRDLAIAVDKDLETQIKNLGFQIVNYKGL